MNSDIKVIKNIEKITGKPVKFVKGDILDGKLLDKVLKKENFDAVIHFAGLKAVGESGEKPLWYYKNNVAGTVTLLESMAKHNVKKIVFSSSACVYGVPKALPYTEALPVTKATNPYGETKIMIERILESQASADKDFSAIILRYFNPVGAHESGLIGEDPTVPNNLMPYIAQVAVGRRPVLQIFGNDYKTPDGTGIRDYIHVVDLAIGHVAAIEKIKTAGVHVFNLGTGKGASVLEIVKAYERANGKPIPYKFVPRRDGDLAIYYASCDKAKKVLGWTATRNIDDMCQSVVKYMESKK